MADFEFKIKLTDKELEKLGVSPDDKQACEEKIMSVLRGESLAAKDLNFDEAVISRSDIELPTESKGAVTAVIFCEDEVYAEALKRAGGNDSYLNFSPTYIASNSELRISINKEIEFGGIGLGMEYDGNYYNIPISENEASKLYDMTNREVLTIFGTSISQYFEDLSSREDERERMLAIKNNARNNDYLSH